MKKSIRTSIGRVIFFWVVLFITFSSCSKVDQFLEHYPKEIEPILNLSGFVSNDSIFICLSESIVRDFVNTDNAADIRVTDYSAVVTLFENGKFFCTLDSTSVYNPYGHYKNDRMNYYVSHKAINENKTYRVEAVHDKYGVLSAETKINEAPVLKLQDSTGYECEAIPSYYAIKDTVVRAIRYKINLEDRVETQDFYRITRQTNAHPHLSDKYRDYENWFMFENIYDNLYYGTPIFNDFTFNGRVHDINYSIFEVLNPYHYLEVYSLSEDFYNYYLSLIKYAEAESDPFSKPMAVYSNVSNGFGFFGGYIRKEFKP